MNVRIRGGLMMLATLVSTAAAAQPPASPSAARHVDPVNGLSLDQAIARALDQEPSLRAARSDGSCASARAIACSSDNPLTGSTYLGAGGAGAGDGVWANAGPATASAATRTLDTIRVVTARLLRR